MAELTTKKRIKVPSSDFGLLSERKHPTPDKAHPRKVEAHAAQQENKGNLTEAEKQVLDHEADRVLGK